MATRSSGTRSKKSSTRALPPVTTVTNTEEQTLPNDETLDAVSGSAADGIVGEASNTGSDVQITGAKLEYREIPSFSESREARIAERAYWRAEQRGFTPGQELEDWLHAEREVDGQGS